MLLRLRVLERGLQRGEASLDHASVEAALECVDELLVTVLKLSACPRQAPCGGVVVPQRALHLADSSFGRRRVGAVGDRVSASPLNCGVEMFEPGELQQGRDRATATGELLRSVRLGVELDPPRELLDDFALAMANGSSLPGSYQWSRDPSRKRSSGLSASPNCPAVGSRIHSPERTHQCGQPSGAQLHISHG